MKFATVFVFLLASAMFNECQASTTSDKLNPITRVVQLLEGLAKKVEQDGKMEEDLFDTYVCWAKTVIKTKTATNEAAKSRIEELEAYIDDIESGRVEFTSERADLEAAIKGLNEEIETADDMRDKEKKDFEAAKEEMEKAIAALEEAVEVLSEATTEKEEKEESGLLSIKHRVKREVQTFRDGEHTGAAAALKTAIELGQRYLSKGDALFLQRVLSGEVPKADWKKLNRKATFKSKYKARSGKIQQILADMLQTFKTNLKDAEGKEKMAAETHKELMESKNEELSGSQEALAAGEKEGSARGMAKEDAEKEVDDLKAQVESDTKYIADTEEALATKKEEWKERKKLRTLEIASINKAIAILNSDEARDTMKSSFKSQGYLLLQKSGKSAVRQRAVEMIRKVELSAKDRRLATLRALLQAGEGPLDEVIKMIDEMVETLKEEEAADLEKKETCEANREKDTASARKLSLEIDDFTELITRKEARIAELKAIIEEKEAEIKAMQEALKEATRKREDEKAAYEAAKADDEAAAKLIQQAKDVLEGFYKDNGLVFAQRGAQPPTNIEAGKAPPPPPATWDAPYGGSKGESTGIQAILSMILEDVEADIKKADDAEKAAIEEYEKFKKDTEESIAANQKAIEDMKGEIADCETAIEEAKDGRISSKGELDSVMEKIKVDEPGCEFMTINFGVRAKNRQMEIDGLLKAKAILQGGSFDAGPDPNREIKPGDAL
eukprot:gnl/MRDRNA2_/MRDRNA2_84115_c0_seq3.p1 gnl/MRDRNA2_/MRDRNA2_84115_c0~~gnl/MRDRNA2_/MRDRNA2_84115_c0_seq3.p1  ORF type:complete len:728 (-),score=277.40 gnl/MRDRNA2_/MRDRNA2_84115_c0_seq3:39-2222(-)